MSAHSAVVLAIFVGVVLCDGTDNLFPDAELSIVALGCRRLDRDAVDNPGGTLKVLFVGICTMVLVYWFVYYITSYNILQFEFVKKINDKINNIEYDQRY